MIIYVPSLIYEYSATKLNEQIKGISATIVVVITDIIAGVFDDAALGIIIVFICLSQTARQTDK